MKLRGFLLGLFSVGGQVLLLRELVSSLNGDELFVGTALFGWLFAVAAGAFLGGRYRGFRGSAPLFILGAILLPIMIIAVRLSPLAVSAIIGEVIPFSKGAALSIIAMIPIGMLSGWLFSNLARSGAKAGDSIVIIYLFEGIGAFVGGVVITVFVGAVASTLSLAIVIGAAVVLMNYATDSIQRMTIIILALCLTVIAAGYFIPLLGTAVDAVKYGSYDVVASFDTHYGREALLTRDDSYVLMTDNSVEAVMPDPETAENQLIVPLIYNPEAKDILYIGRSEFGAAQIAESLNRRMTAIDPRKKLSAALSEIIQVPASLQRIDDDPVRFFSRMNITAVYDIIVINPGEPDNYQNCRYFTSAFLGNLKSRLKRDGIVLFPTSYDTDRYIAPEKGQVLSILRNTIGGSFKHIAVWPGNMTLFLASNERELELPLDSIVKRIERLPYDPSYIHENYIFDRLGSLKVERLHDAIAGGSMENIVDRPLLAHYQALYRSMTSRVDRALMKSILQRPAWMVLIPALIGLFFVLMFNGHKRPGRFGLFLYFTAGIVSLSLELISFYLYQTKTGSLYSEMAVLIGAFMMGLAVGTYYSHKVETWRPLEYPALALLLAATLIFMTTHGSISHDALVFFHTSFLFVVAVATGTLFVAATNRYYAATERSNRGAGYAWELVGSSVGALITTTILLPILGLQWLLLSLAALIIIALGGAILSCKI